MMQRLQRLTLVALLLFAQAGPASAAITFVASTFAGVGAGTVGADTETTGVSAAIDTTGATLLAMFVSRYGGASPAPTPVDSKGNTWVALTDRSSGAVNASGRWFYVASPTVGTGHTFHADGTTAFPAMVVFAFAGVHTTPLDQQNGATTLSASSLATGSVTPTQDNELVLAGYAGQSDTPNATIDNSLSTPVEVDVSGSNYSADGAYKIQTTAAAVNPTWTFSASGEGAVAIATFKAAAGGGAAVAQRLLLLGVGQ